MRRFIMFSTALVTVTLLCSSAALFAQQPSRSGRGGPGPRVAGAGVAQGERRPGRLGRGRIGVRLARLGRALDVTPDQRAAMRAAVQGMRTEAAPLTQELRAVASQLRAIRQSGSPDDAKVAELRAKAKGLRTQLADLRSRHRPALLDVLTPDQKAALQARRARRN